jgi:hypothetical protein
VRSVSDCCSARTSSQSVTVCATQCPPGARWTRRRSGRRFRPTGAGRNGPVGEPLPEPDSGVGQASSGCLVGDGVEHGQLLLAAGGKHLDKAPPLLPNR